MTTLDPIETAVTTVGLADLARALGVTHQAVRKWQRARRMPRTEWTGETEYSDTIERLTRGAVTRTALLAKWPEGAPEVPATQEAA